VLQYRHSAVLLVLGIRRQVHLAMCSNACVRDSWQHWIGNLSSEVVCASEGGHKDSDRAFLHAALCLIRHHSRVARLVKKH
jgi:hypothetical protein